MASTTTTTRSSSLLPQRHRAKIWAATRHDWIFDRVCEDVDFVLLGSANMCNSVLLLV